ncbi:MAG TPA: TerB family tellurite resistance protein [Cyclobacteriaceae bacterium]|jgi:uncharacterized tellurite resistance protein B-like protein|nr:TerB family tellurite resistance protein [Cyclobacteriaceae bacterium]HRK54456.1 TerB family tellurite resistance protein [Cyclobacteriaceae bacterium]
MVIHNTFADFVLFLYIHMAHADGEYHPSEEEAILNKIPKLYPTEGDPVAKLKSALAAYKKLKSDDIKGIIHDSFPHFEHIKFSQKYKVYTDMFDIVHADGKVHDAEQRALAELKDIIHEGSQK